MRQGCSGNRSRGGQARKPAKNEASRIEGCEIRDLSRVEMRLASAPLAVKSRFSRGFGISTLIRYHYPGRERLLISLPYISTVTNPDLNSPIAPATGTIHTRGVNSCFF